MTTDLFWEIPVIADFTLGAEALYSRQGAAFSKYDTPEGTTTGSKAGM